MSSAAKSNIKPVADGPYLVKALTRFSNNSGPIECKETMFLCRCGASANKPFCDGSHAKIGFSSARLEGRSENKLESYKGKRISIHDNRSICAHAGFCTDNLAAVFRMRQEPWIDADAADVEEIIATIQMCPSGALSYSVEDGENNQQYHQAEIRIAPNGPYLVNGGPDLVDANWGEGASKSRYSLCRCGASKNKPFCDGSHWDIGFTDDKN